MASAGEVERLHRAITSEAVAADDRVNALRELVGSRPADEAAATLRDATAGLHPDLIGYGVLPPLLPWLRSEDGFRAALRIAEDEDTDMQLRIVLLDFLDAAAHGLADAAPYPHAL